MAQPIPEIDERTAKDIAEQVRALLAVYVPEQFQQDEDNPKPLQGVSAALVNIFARFAEITIQRLNQVPQKNFLAFLNLLGASQLPPQSARVPLTFSLVEGDAVDAIVPAGTQVSVSATEEGGDPILFETERDLIVTATQLASIFTRDLHRDTYGECGVLDGTTPDATIHIDSMQSIFQADRPIEHALYIGHDRLLGFAETIALKLSFEVVAVLENGGKVEWQVWDGRQWSAIAPSRDTAPNFNQRGFHEIEFSALTAVPLKTVNTIENRWLRCRLKTPITPATEAQPGRVRASQLPKIRSLALQATLARDRLAIEHALTNQQPLDLSQEFFPFGDNPKFGDTWYLAAGDAFGQFGAMITLQIDLLNPASGDAAPPIPRTYTEGIPQLRWEMWNGTQWIAIGSSIPHGSAPAGSHFFEDNTRALTDRAQPDEIPTVQFVLPEPPVPLVVGGIDSFWLRVRLVRGHYGEDARYEPIDADDLSAGYRLVAATLAPPAISSIRVSYRLTTPTAPELPETVLTENDFLYSDNLVPRLQAVNESVVPFQASQEDKSYCYLGFLPPLNRPFPNLPVAMYCQVETIPYHPTVVPVVQSPHLIWEYGSTEGWQRLTISDSTEALTQSGLIEFLPPADFAWKTEFGLEQYWLRVRWKKGDYQTGPKLQRLLLHTTMAAQTTTIRNEVLGSSTGSEDQQFRSTRTPILKGQQLEVREPELPSAEEHQRLEQEEGTEGISLNLDDPDNDDPDNADTVWVRWHEVPDFYGSGPRDRHYLIDRLSGEIRFGNGLNGMIPPMGTGNLRLARYQTDGGTAGNQPIGAITQLKTTVPYIDSVANPEPATGGIEAETMAALLERAPRQIRHRDRAVTLEDYEDLAKLASPTVARAKCVPLRDLRTDPLGQEKCPGTVSLIIVPQSDEAKPLPIHRLIHRIQTDLETRADPTINLVVVGPLYIRIEVTIEIALTSFEAVSSLEKTIEQTLAKFLHPLTGGFDNNGWNFGRTPHPSDFYHLLGSISDIDRIHALDIDEIEEQPETKHTNCFLVYSGKHTINFVFDG